MRVIAVSAFWRPWPGCKQLLPSGPWRGAEASRHGPQVIATRNSITYRGALAIHAQHSSAALVGNSLALQPVTAPAVIVGVGCGESGWRPDSVYLCR